MRGYHKSGDWQSKRPLGQVDGPIPAMYLWCVAAAPHVRPSPRPGCGPSPSLSLPLAFGFPSSIKACPSLPLTPGMFLVLCPLGNSAGLFWAFWLLGLSSYLTTGTQVPGVAPWLQRAGWEPVHSQWPGQAQQAQRSQNWLAVTWQGLQRQPLDTADCGPGAAAAQAGLTQADGSGSPESTGGVAPSRELSPGTGMAVGP